MTQLTGSTIAGTTTAYAFDATTNRTSVQIGAGTPATTAYNAANRPISGTNPTASYSSDDDGRLVTRPSQQLVWDDLGRLTQVKDGTGVILATYTYDPLDRLRTVDTAGVGRIRFRYVGLTTTAAQWLDDVAGTVTRHIGTGWSGERLLDWTGTGSNIRIYGTNAHHDVTWLASSTGTVSQALRYDPWGNPRATVPSGYSPFRFQGSWFDDETSLSWVVTRWYAPSLGRFVSEDTLLGDPIDPPSRHLYAYGHGEPIGRWDPDGRYWYVIKNGDTLGSVASKRLHIRSNWPMIYNANRSNRSVVKSTETIVAGKCLLIPWRWITYSPSGKTSDPKCAGMAKPESFRRANQLMNGKAGLNPSVIQGSAIRMGITEGFWNVSPEELYASTTRWAGRTQRAVRWTPSIDRNVFPINAIARQIIRDATSRGRLVPWNGLTEVYGNSSWPSSFDRGGFVTNAFTAGHYIFYGENIAEPAPKDLRSHEYIHVLQWENLGLDLLGYLGHLGKEPSHNPYEAIGYLWQGWTWAYGEASYDRYSRPVR